MSVIDEIALAAKMGSRAAVDSDDDVDEGFDSRPSSSMEHPRLSSSSGSSSDDEIFWGERLTSAKHDEAVTRLAVYKKELEKNPVVAKDFQEFKKDYGPLPSSRKGKLLAANNVSSEATKVLATTATDVAAIAVDLTAIAKSTDEGLDAHLTPVDLSKRADDSPQRSPLNLKRKWNSVDEDDFSPTAYQSDLSMGDSKPASSGRPLETVVEAGSEEEEEDGEGKKEQCLFTPQVFSSGLGTIEKDVSSQLTIASNTDILPNPPAVSCDEPIKIVIETESVSVSPYAENSNISPVDPSTSLFCSSIGDPDGLLASNVSSFNIPSSSTPRSSLLKEPVDATHPLDEAMVRRKSTVESIRAKAEEEEMKVEQENRLIEAKMKRLQLKKRMKELEEEEKENVEECAKEREGRENELKACLKQEKNDGKEKSSSESDQDDEFSKVRSVENPILPLENHASEVMESAEDKEAKRHSDSDLDDQQLPNTSLDSNSDASLLNLTSNTTLNTTVFGVSCRQSEIFGDSLFSTKQNEPSIKIPSKSISGSTSTPFQTVKGVSSKPSPLKSPSLCPPASSNAAKKGVASSSSKTPSVTPGRNVAWKEKMFSSPANSSPSQAAAVTPGRSVLKKSAAKPHVPGSGSLPMTPPNRRVLPTGSGASPSLKPSTPASGAEKTPIRTQPPNKSLFGLKSPGAIKLPANSPGPKKFLNGEPSTPKTPGGTFKTPSSPAIRKSPNGHLKANYTLNLSRSPAAAASRGAMMARSPSVVSGAKTGVKFPSPGSALMAPRSPGASLKTSNAGNLLSPSVGSGKSPRAMTPSRIGFIAPGMKRAAPTTPGSGAPLKTASGSKAIPRPATPIASANRPISSTPGKSLTPKTLSFHK